MIIWEPNNGAVSDCNNRPRGICTLGLIPCLMRLLIHSEGGRTFGYHEVFSVEMQLEL